MYDVSTQQTWCDVPQGDSSPRVDSGRFLIGTTCREYNPTYLPTYLRYVGQASNHCANRRLGADSNASLLIAPLSK